jgi:tRNA(Arg) A34 adenosine deaminase TadA
MINAQHGELDQEFMALALYEAGQALDAGDYPVGAVLTILFFTLPLNHV